MLDYIGRLQNKPDDLKWYLGVETGTAKPETM
jgi:hypothetical protein